MHLYRLGELNLVLLNRFRLIRVPINENLLYITKYLPETLDYPFGCYRFDFSPNVCSYLLTIHV